MDRRTYLFHTKRLALACQDAYGAGSSFCLSGSGAEGVPDGWRVFILSARGVLQVGAGPDALAAFEDASKHFDLAPGPTVPVGVGRQG